jgi:hypothetical protein
MGPRLSVIAGLLPLFVVSFHAGQLDLSWCGTAEAAKACGSHYNGIAESNIVK